MTKTRDLANLIADSKVGPSEIDTAGTYNMNALQVGGTTVINSSRAGNFNTGTVVGTYTTAPSGNPGQLAISRTGSAPYVSWHHEDGTRLGNIQFANASSTIYLSNEMSNGKWNFWNGTTTAAQIDHNGAAYFGGTTQASATRFVHTGGIIFSNGASTGGEFLSWDNEGATGNQSLIGYWYDGSSYRNRFRIAGDHGETVVNGSADDVNFRVASDTKQHMFFVDASANKIGINQSSPAAILDVHSTTADADGILRVYQNVATGNPTVKILQRGEGGSAGTTQGLMLDIAGHNQGLGYIINTSVTNSNVNSGVAISPFSVRGIGTFQFRQGGVINENGADSDFRVESDSNSNAFVIDAGDNLAAFAVKTSLYDGSAGNSPSLIFGGETAAGPQKSIYLDTYYMVHQIHVNEGLKFRFTSGTTASFDDRHLIKNNEVVWNETSKDTDFRIESDSNAHMFHIDAGISKAAFGTAPQTAIGGMVHTGSLSVGNGNHFGYSVYSNHEGNIPSNTIVNIMDFEGPAYARYMKVTVSGYLCRKEVYFAGYQSWDNQSGSTVGSTTTGTQIFANGSNSTSARCNIYLEVLSTSGTSGHPKYRLKLGTGSLTGQLYDTTSVVEFFNPPQYVTYQ